MNSYIEIINPIDYQGWDDELLTSHERSSFFHTAIWARVLWDSYGYTPLYFTVREHDRLLGLLPMMEVNSMITGRRGGSLPFTDYCEPLISSDVDLEELMDAAKQYGREHGWKSVEIRGGCPANATIATFYYRHTLDLETDVEKLFSRLKGNTRRGVRKAKREGVTIEINTSVDAVDEYYRLHCITRKKHGLPPQPRAFFRKIHEHIIAPGMGRVVIASHEGKNIAASVFFGYQGKALYKYGASDPTFLRLRPTDLVMWEGIKWYAENGYTSLCFGRTAPNNTGLRDFKLRWDTKEEQINYYKYDLRQEAYVEESLSVGGLPRHLFGMMPIPLLTILGARLYKHMG